MNKTMVLISYYKYLLKNKNMYVLILILKQKST